MGVGKVWLRMAYSYLSEDVIPVHLLAIRGREGPDPPRRCWVGFIDLLLHHIKGSFIPKRPTRRLAFTLELLEALFGDVGEVQVDWASLRAKIETVPDLAGNDPLQDGAVLGALEEVVLGYLQLASQPVPD